MTEQKHEAEQKYFERLNISVLSIKKIKDLIKTDIKNTIRVWESGKDIDRQTFRVVGPAGVGKTHICRQIVDELTDELFGEYNKGKSPDQQKQFQLSMIKASNLSKDDLMIPFPIIDNGNTSFKMLYSDFVYKDPDSYGLFVIDEFSRGDRTLQQALMQIQNEYKIHFQDLPKHWFVISVDNPDDSEYELETMSDAAVIRRQLHLYVEVSPKDFIEHAIERKFHRTVIEFIQTHPNFLYDFESQKIGAVFANPASYEFLSGHMYKFEMMPGGIGGHFDDIENIASGLLNTHKARLFIEFLKEGKDINPNDIFNNYKHIQPKILALKKEGDNATLTNVMTAFTTFIISERPDWNEDQMNNIKKFLIDMPLDSAAIFITQIDKFERNSIEFKYITGLHMRMMKDQKYQDIFYNPMVKTGEENANN